ncbi:MAG: hypothetical protein U0521_28635 [Anaerolineae bacterium]
MRTVELRVEGEADDVAATVAWLRACFKVIKESKPYIDRPPSRSVRVYVEIQAEPPPEREENKRGG